MPVTRHRPHRSERASFSHSALPESVRKLCRWVEDGWTRQWEAAQELVEPQPEHPSLLATASECPLPQSFDLLEEALHGPVVAGQSVIGVVAAQYRAEIIAWDRSE